MSERYLYPAPCGLICDECEYFHAEEEPSCDGCKNVKGKPFWGECIIYQCCKGKNLEHCGLCNEFPCGQLIEQYDPNMLGGPQEAIFRIGQLAIRKKKGTEKWLKQRKEGKLVSYKNLEHPITKAP
jgi:hypothetical protein